MEDRNNNLPRNKRVFSLGFPHIDKSPKTKQDNHAPDERREQHGTASSKTRSYPRLVNHHHLRKTPTR